MSKTETMKDVARELFLQGYLHAIDQVAAGLRLGLTPADVLASLRQTAVRVEANAAIAKARATQLEE